MSETEIPARLRPSRRNFLGTAAMTAAGLAVAAAAIRPTPASAATVTDSDILNFALNLEYLEAEYYLHAVTGAGLTADQTSGIGSGGGIRSLPTTPRVTFATPAIQQYAEEIAQDELNHVLFLRSALGSQTYAEPGIDIGNAFNVLANAAGIGSGFDPFASELNFLIGAFIFEDVGVTAYNGAAPLISNKAYLGAAASIMGTEAYHASEVRTLLASMNSKAVFSTITKISRLRNALDGSVNDDQGLLAYGTNNLNIVPTDKNSLVYARTTSQVLNIVYGTPNAGVTEGLFFPNGMNGVIVST